MSLLGFASAWKVTSTADAEYKEFTVGEGEHAKRIRFKKIVQTREAWAMNSDDMKAAFKGGMIVSLVDGIAKDDPGLHAVLSFIVDNVEMPAEAKKAIKQAMVDALAHV